MARSSRIVTIHSRHFSLCDAFCFALYIEAELENGEVFPRGIPIYTRGFHKRW